uniref:Putative membrane protein n=1 Tax=Ornithodoros turicata TaxID=34597 RepID=A0A2R5LHW2_9ACAR
MAVLHKVLLTWFLFTIFFILLALRLDEKTEWNWFLVFVPMWLFDVKLMLYIAVQLLSICRRRHDTPPTIRRKVWCLFCLLLKTAFQLGVCIRLQYTAKIPWVFVALPLWIMLLSISVNILMHLIAQR